MFLDDDTTATDDVAVDATAPEVETHEGGMEASAPEVESHEEVASDEAPTTEEAPIA